MSTPAGLIILFPLFLSLAVAGGPAFAGEGDPGGKFGHWELDKAGLPCFHYTLDEYSDPAARYDTSLGKSNDHWHVVGNDRVVALAYNHGQILLYSGERGSKWYNAPDAKRIRKSGGYGFLQEGDTLISTFYAERPQGASLERIFGTGYYQKRIATDAFSIDQVILAPFGADPCWVSQVSLTNNSERPRSIAWYEYWDVNLVEFGQMFEVSGQNKEGKRRGSSRLFDSLVSSVFRLIGKKDEPGFVSGLVYKFLDGYRRGSTRKFRVSTSRDGDLLIASYRDPDPPVRPDERSLVDHYPLPFFLAPLDQPLLEFETDRTVFFNKKDRPLLRCTNSLVQDASAKKSPVCLAIRKSLDLSPGETRTLRFLLGYAEPTAAKNLVSKYKPEKDSLFSMQSAWAHALPELDIEPEWLEREMRWHAYYLRALFAYDDYFQSFILSQGCTYQYLLGMNIAARDPLQHMLAMVYLEPGLAREILRYTLSSMDPKGFIAYGIKGIGMRTAGGNPFPSDTNLYLMLALSEYVLATREFAFLKENLPYYPIEDGKSGTVLEHMELAFKHQINDVGIGRHGLIKARNSDWNDTFISEEKQRHPDMDPLIIESESESVLNTAMATYILPYFAEMLEAGGEKEFAGRVLASAQSFRKALAEQWNGQWFNRGWVAGDRRAGGSEQLYISPQPWTILGHNLDPIRELALVETLWTELSARSPIGAVMRWPPPEPGVHHPGEGTFGGIWYSLNMPLVWAYSRVKPEYAWQEFLHSTLGNHAMAYPDLWVGIWSGPDSYNSPQALRPGMPWDTFPFMGGMIDFPVMCGHAHACPWFSLIKLAGVQPSADGFIIDPRIPSDDFEIQTSLVSLRRKGRVLSGSIRPLDDGPITFKVRTTGNYVQSRGQSISCSRDGDFLGFTIQACAGKEADWEIISR
jgi:hypothetical protein